MYVILMNPLDVIRNEKDLLFFYVIFVLIPYWPVHTLRMENSFVLTNPLELLEMSTYN